ncbi:hypothetical protein CC78DRAFT_577390 [Lojkania enalia]|uniref:Uncharacterized protein n=1 Tax=Lojkania enalia TaxID=147567 RepID=A0A9P4N5K8_9PLEO|nr:hypothetical protein CC78DRAFT_577390 [Didymosphaeria enalia]
MIALYPCHRNHQINSQTYKTLQLHQLQALLRLRKSSFLTARIRLDLIIAEVLRGLYSPSKARESWGWIQKSIISFIDRLGEWEASLPVTLKFVRSIEENKISRDRFLLAFYCQSARLLVLRPCLCPLEERIKSQSQTSEDLNEQISEAWVQAALALTVLLPNHPDPVFLYRNGPWWSIVHIIMQAMAVLLLEISYRVIHMTRDGKNLTGSAKKLMQRLRSMRADDLVAGRAYMVVYNILKSDSPQIQVDIADILGDEDVDMEPTQQRDVRKPSSNASSLLNNQPPIAQHNMGDMLDYPTASNVFNAQMSLHQVGQQSHFTSSGFNCNQDFAWDPYLLLQQGYGNPFFMGFNQPKFPNSIFATGGIGDFGG